MRRLLPHVSAILVFSFSAAAVSSDAPTAGITSLLGQPLVAQALAPEDGARMEAQLADARTAWEQDRNDADALIWVGRRTAYLGRYREAIESDIADLKNDPDAWAQAGATTAALFLEKFAPTDGSWAHFDVYAWNPKGRPGHPTGGEAQAIRALLLLLKTRFPA